MQKLWRIKQETIEVLKLEINIFTMVFPKTLNLSSKILMKLLLCWQI